VTQAFFQEKESKLNQRGALVSLAKGRRKEKISGRTQVSKRNLCSALDIVALKVKDRNCGLVKSQKEGGGIVVLSSKEHGTPWLLPSFRMLCIQGTDYPMVRMTVSSKAKENVRQES
jgi:hypothetical protein